MNEPKNKNQRDRIIANKLNPSMTPPHCPLLCGKEMERSIDVRRGLFLFTCKQDRIAIRIDDPFVGRWEAAYHKSTDGKGIPCNSLKCEGKTKYFATARGYMKNVCVKCGAYMECGEPERDPNDWVSPEKPGVVQ